MLYRNIKKKRADKLARKHLRMQYTTVKGGETARMYIEVYSHISFCKKTRTQVCFLSMNFVIKI